VELKCAARVGAGVGGRAVRGQAIEDHLRAPRCSAQPQVLTAAAHCTSTTIPDLPIGNRGILRPQDLGYSLLVWPPWTRAISHRGNVHIPIGAAVLTNPLIHVSTQNIRKLLCNQISRELLYNQYIKILLYNQNIGKLLYNHYMYTTKISGKITI
jgi:hypothetical protein